MNLSDSPTVGQFDIWAIIAVHAAAQAATRATAEQVRSLQLIGAQLVSQRDAEIWESIANAWHTGILEAAGNAMSAVAADELWSSVTNVLDVPPMLWALRDRVESSMSAVVAAVTGGTPESADATMRAHVDTVRTALFSASA